MTNIRRVVTKDAELLSELSIATFLPAHGHSAPKKDIDNYLKANFTPKNLTKEISEENNLFHFVYKDNKIAGYSKIILNQSEKFTKTQNTTYLSRIYLLPEYYGLGLGEALFDFNLAIAKRNIQTGIWLFVWVENKKAISFYNKMGFKKIGQANFKISETHSNPNHVLYLSLN